MFTVIIGGNVHVWQQRAGALTQAAKRGLGVVALAIRQAGDTVVRSRSRLRGK